MNIVHKRDNTDIAVSRAQVKQRLLYSKKENRDKAYILLKNAGITSFKSSLGLTLIHPEYIEDYSGEIETGFGNTMYQTRFAKLYILTGIGEKVPRIKPNAVTGQASEVLQ
jgi:hypothetical protein